MTHFGFDASHWQHTMDAAAAKAGGAEWAWLKSSEAVSYTDPSYAPFSTDCTRAGLPWGPYHFVREVATPAQQAAYWASKAGGHGGALPVLDIETDPSTQGYVRALVAESDARFGLKVAIYTFDAFIDTHPWLADYANDPGRTLVVARYSTNPPRHRHQAWQHTDKAAFPGFASPPDGDQTENLAYVLVGRPVPSPDHQPIDIGGLLSDLTPEQQQAAFDAIARSEAKIDRLLALIPAFDEWNRAQVSENITAIAEHDGVAVPPAP